MFVYLRIPHFERHSLTEQSEEEMNVNGGFTQASNLV